MRLQDRAEDNITQEPAPGAPIDAEASVESHGLYRVGLAYGRFIYRFRWIVLALWLVGLAVSVPFAAKLPSILTGGGYSFSGSESTRASDVLTTKLNQSGPSLLVAFTSTTANVSDTAYQAEIASAANAARAFPHVQNVTQGGVSKDGHTTYLVVAFNKGYSDVEQAVPDFKAKLPSGADASPAKIYVTGSPAIYADFTRITQEDTERSEAAALPIALLVLLIVFGTLVAALLPLTLALVAVPVALAILYAIALHYQTSVFVLNVASIIGLGISIDYSLFMVRRFREELDRGRSVRDAVGWTVATSGEAILFSGLTVIIGFVGMLLIGIDFMTSMGLGGACVVGAAVIAALTLLPALLSIIGTRVNALRLPFIGRLVTRRERNADNTERQGFWHGWAMGVMRRPVLIIFGVTALLIALGWPIFSLNVGTPGASSLPQSSEARQGLDLLNQQFPETAQNPILIVAQSPDGSSMLTPANLARVENLTFWIGGRQHITGVTSLTQIPSASGQSAPPIEQLFTLYTTGAYQQNAALSQFVSSTTNGDTTLITAYTNAPSDSAAGKALIDDIRAGDQDAGLGLKVQVGGFQATSLDFNRYLYDNFPKAIAFILITTFILLLLMFRSVLLPLKAVVMNVLSVGASYGVLVFVFQQGHFSDQLGFTSDGFIDSTIPILLFCILFGLSMDYEVFLLSRVREEWLRTRNNRYAVARGLEKTGGVITNAALLFMIVAGAFIFASIIIIKEIGLGMTVAVLVDAAIIRTLLVPATMRLIGRWNWWLPGRPIPVERKG
jgi:RND superfamily putative drug exporter